mgnify:CR=1 FL=1
MSKGKKGGVDESAAVVASAHFDASAFMIRLVSNDEHVFIADRNCVKVSKLFKQVLTSAQAGTGDEIDGVSYEAPSLHTSVAVPASQAVDPAPGTTVSGTSPLVPAALGTLRVSMLNAEQLQFALKFMYTKYRFDNDVAGLSGAWPLPPGVPLPAVGQQPFQLTGTQGNLSASDALCVAALLRL